MRRIDFNKTFDDGINIIEEILEADVGFKDIKKIIDENIIHKDFVKGIITLSILVKVINNE